MANSGANFSFEIQQWVEGAKAKTIDVARKVVFDLSNRVIRKTPVDTGRAKGNWSVTLESPDNAVSTRLDPTPQGSVSGETRGHISDTVSQIDENTHTAFIWNNLPYIQALEDGHSDQAPQGMVKTTIAEYHGIVEKIAREVNTKRTRGYKAGSGK